jgi:DMSO/TMAO reductase YedYZ molybdopterin-dependent catalytic subunit
MEIDRRTFIKLSALSAAGTFLPLAPLRSENNPKTWVRKNASPSSWVTPTKEFYVQDITSGNPPKLEPDKWRLILNGLVQKSKILRLPNIMEKESLAVTTHRTLSCIGDPIGGEQISNAEWTGIPLRVFLEEAGVRPEATRVVFRCADLYHTAIPIADAMNPKTLLAFKMNGETLPVEHGYPIRLLNPGKYGQKCPKWINNIELIAKQYDGYWETRGWSDVAAVRTATRVHVPTKGARLPEGTYTISGSAFDGGNDGGIARVQVSTDGGKTWNDAEIWSSADPLTWSLWQYTWKVPNGTKSAKILARAVNSKGTVQSSKYEDPYPAGASGYHSVEVEIVS